MGLIKEPLNVDFVVNPRPLTREEQAMISDYIKADKAKRKNIEEKQKKNQAQQSAKKAAKTIAI